MVGANVLWVALGVVLVVVATTVVRTLVDSVALWAATALAFLLLPWVIDAVREGGAGALLREAAAAGKEKMVEALLGAGVSPFAADARLNTALHLAAAAGHVRICRMLRDKGEHEAHRRHEVCTRNA